MLDISLLRIMKYQKDFNTLYPGLPTSALDPVTVTLLEDFKKYFSMFPSHEKIDFQILLPRFEMWHGTWNTEKLAACETVLKLAETDVDEETKAALSSDLLEFNLATQLNTSVQAFQEGTLETPLYHTVTAHIDEFKMRCGAKACAWDDTPIEDLIKEDEDQSGIKFRLKALNDCMRPLRPGDFGIIAGRPDKGKTSFVASEISFMASQLPEDKNIIWLNNEGISSRIRKRVFQAALGMSIQEMIEASKTQDLLQLYINAVGRADKIRIFSVHEYHVGQIDAIIEQSNPGIVVYDMIDNIRGFGSESRTDLQLERMYQWARERAVKYSCIGLATSQISGDADGVMYPSMSALKDSKTGKQGACDFLLMIGSSNDEHLKNCRFLSVPKNKLRREDAPGTTRTEVLFDQVRGLYKDVQ